MPESERAIKPNGEAGGKKISYKYTTEPFTVSIPTLAFVVKSVIKCSQGKSNKGILANVGDVLYCIDIENATREWYVKVLSGNHKRDGVFWKRSQGLINEHATKIGFEVKQYTVTCLGVSTSGNSYEEYYLIPFGEAEGKGNKNSLWVSRLFYDTHIKPRHGGGYPVMIQGYAANAEPAVDVNMNAPHEEVIIDNEVYKNLEQENAGAEEADVVGLQGEE